MYHLSPHTSHCSAFTTDPTQLLEFLIQNQVFSWCLHTSGMWRYWGRVRHVQRGSAQFSSFLALSLNMCPLTSQEVSSNHPLFPSHTSWVEQWNSGPSTWLQTVKSAHFLSYLLTQTPLILLYSPVVQLLGSVGLWLNSTHQFAFLFHCLQRNIYFFKDSYMFWFYLWKFYLNHHVFGAEKVS